MAKHACLSASASARWLNCPPSAKLCAEAGVPCSTATVTTDVPYEAIIEASNQAGCDLIFMASHGRRGLGALLLGSETNKVLAHSKVPLLVYR